MWHMSGSQGLWWCWRAREERGKEEKKKKKHPGFCRADCEGVRCEQPSKDENLFLRNVARRRTFGPLLSVQKNRSSAEFCDSLSAYQIPSYVLFVAALFNVSKVRVPRFRVPTLSFKWHLNFHHQTYLSFHSGFAFFIFSCKEVVCVSVSTCVGFSVSVSQSGRVVLVSCRMPLIILDALFFFLQHLTQSGAFCVHVCVHHWDSPCMNYPDSIPSLSQHFLSCCQRSNWIDIYWTTQVHTTLSSNEGEATQWRSSFILKLLLLVGGIQMCTVPTHSYVQLIW